MTTENVDYTQPSQATMQQSAQPRDEKLFTQEEVTRIAEERRKRDAEALRLKHEENQRLQQKLQEYEKKMQQGTASTHDMQQYQAAEYGAEQAMQQGIPPEHVAAIVNREMKIRDLETKLVEANQKDPEFAKLVEANRNKDPRDTDRLTEDHVKQTAFLKNSPAVIKYLLKDSEARQIYLNAYSNAAYDGGVSAQLALKNISDRLMDANERPRPNQYQPPADLSDASDEDQNFDEDDYIKSKY